MGLTDSAEYLHIKPAQLDPKDYDKLGIIDLHKQGYALGLTPDELFADVTDAYDGHDKEERIDIFLATINGKAIGSITTVNWSEGEPIRGDNYWSLLKKHAPQTHELVHPDNRRAVEVIGRVTHPDFRRKGISAGLLQFMAQEMQPALITGQTKSPEAVLARTSALDGLGFATFYGSFNTSGDTGLKIPSGLIESYLGVRNIPVEEDGVYYYEGRLGSGVPDLSQLPDNIKSSFGNVIAKQQAATNKSLTAVKPLISLRRDLVK